MKGPLFWYFLLSGRKGSEPEAIWREGESAGHAGPGGEVKGEKMREPERRRGRDGEAPGGAGTRGRAGGTRGGGHKERARSERARRRREGEGPRPAGRPGCLIFCQPRLINGPPSSSERAAPRSWQRRARLPGGGGACGKVTFAQSAAAQAARRGCGAGVGVGVVGSAEPGARRGAAGEPGPGREKAAALGAVWVMETFLWGPGRKISGCRAAAHAAPPRGASCRRPPRAGLAEGCPRCVRPSPCALVPAPQPVRPSESRSDPRAPACALRGRRLAFASPLPSLRRQLRGPRFPPVVASGPPPRLSPSPPRGPGVWLAPGPAAVRAG